MLRHIVELPRERHGEALDFIPLLSCFHARLALALDAGDANFDIRFAANMAF